MGSNSSVASLPWRMSAGAGNLWDRQLTAYFKMIFGPPGCSAHSILVQVLPAQRIGSCTR